MKKLLPLFCILGCVAQPALAGSISNLGALTQPEFRDLSEDLGSALSYKAVTPAAPLGTTGFDMGIEVTQTKTAKSSQLWSTITGTTDTVSNLYVPKLHIAKGLPFGIDVAAFYAKIPSYNIKLVGAELRYAILQGGIAQPAIGLRYAFSKMSGGDQLALGTRSLDVSISKGFAMITPYAGVGEVWTDSNPNAGSLTKESFTQGKTFVGANLNLGVTNIAAEWDKTGAASSITVKLGFRF